jgi:macrolide-specific efflux system membrane fusion protein
MSTTLERGPVFGDVSSESDWQGASPGRIARLRRVLLRPVVVIPLVLAIGAAVWFSTRSTSSPTAAAVSQTVAVTSGTMRQSVSAAGTLEPANSQNLSFSTSGKVTAVNVKAGQQVATGAVLATLDSAALQSQVSQAQSTVDAAAARLSSDQSSAASAAQLASDQASVNAANAQLASAQTSLAGATLTSPMDGTVAVVNLTVGQQLSGTGTSGTSITGTGTGSGRSTASSGSTSSGSNSSAQGGSGNGSTSSSSSSSSTAQIQVISTGSYVVNLNVDDTQIGRIAAGQQATITPSSSPTGTGAGRRLGGAGGGGGQGATGQGGQAGQGANNGQGTNGQGTNAQAAAGGFGQPAAATATGTVTSVGAIASSSSGVASFPVVVTVTGTPSGFFAGSTVQVAITYNELPNVLEVPTLAVTRSNGQDYVTVSQNGKHSQRAVTTGLVSGGQTQITSGLSRGDLVVVTIPTVSGNGATPNNATTGNRGGGFGGGGGFVGGGGGGFGRGGGG